MTQNDTLNKFLRGKNMKKIAIASIIALAATAASALEISTSAVRDYSGNPDRNGAGLSLTKRYGAVGVTAGVNSFTKGPNDQDRYSVIAGYDVAKVGAFTVTPKLGVAYLDNRTSQDGYAMTVGAGVSTPITKNVTLGLDVARQYGQDRVQAFDGNTVAVGLSYKF
jgi:outer membrane autotransporter protein